MASTRGHDHSEVGSHNPKVDVATRKDFARVTHPQTALQIEHDDREHTLGAKIAVPGGIRSETSFCCQMNDKINCMRMQSDVGFKLWAVECSILSILVAPL